TEDSYGSMLELSWNATKTIPLKSTTRTFLEDGDEVILKGSCGSGPTRFGFGDCAGVIVPNKLSK
ncbi:hypothetical protein HDV02_000887, partial [Globomyces sp. JEL0801]